LKDDLHKIEDSWRAIVVHEIHVSVGDKYF